MGFPAVEGLSRTRIQRYAGEIAVLAFFVGYGFGQLAEWGTGVGFYLRCAILVGLVLLIGYRLRRVPASRDRGAPLPQE